MSETRRDTMKSPVDTMMFCINLTMLLLIVISGIYNIKRLTDTSNAVLKARDRFWRADNRRLALARDVYSRLVDKTRIFAFIGGLLLIYYFFQLLAGYLSHLQDRKVI